MQTLERIANIAVIFTCVVVCGAIVSRFVSRPRAIPAYKAGDTIKDTPKLGLKNSPETIILVTSSRCRYCSESMPFYRALLASVKQSRSRVVAVTPEDPVVNKAFLHASGVEIETVLSMQENGISRQGTPMLIIVRSDGQVTAAWRGQLDKAAERDILRRIVNR